MKNQLLVVIGLLGMVISACGQVIMPESALTVSVVDEAGQPIAGAKVGIEDDVFGKPPSGGGISDEGGMHTGTLRTWGSLYFGARMDGYYSAGGEFQFDHGSIGKDTSQWREKKWTPWNPTVRVTLKKKGQAIAMYAKRVYLAPPVSDGTPVGFDLEAGDWLAPHGTGKRADMFFSATGTIENSDLGLTWSFPNKGDGIIVYPYDGGARSELRSPTQAPQEGYLPEITVDAEGRPKGQSGDARPLSFVFRVRTVLDDAGNVVTANYGKIYPEAYKAVFYLNPTPNSHVLEYDPRKNLLTGLKSHEMVNEP
ncbi:MAG: hypothetical protein SFU53_07095 [Terrimicrobiaceae bacterium]|nr:hypothetical protein [Terrimicrobiaceae bacterium]